MSTISSEHQATDLLKHTYRVPEALMTGRHTEVLKTVTTQYNLWKKHLPEAYKHYFHDTNELIPSSSYLTQKVNAFVNVFWQYWTGQPEFKLPFDPSCWSYIYNANEKQLKEDASLPPLHFAIKYKKLDMVKALLKEKGVDSVFQLKDENATVNFAATQGDPDFYVDLIKMGCSKLGKHLIDAVRKGDVRVITALIKAGADVNAKHTYTGRTPLHVAALSEQVKVIHTLVELGADINVKNNWGETPLHVDAERGTVGCINVLASYGADVNPKDCLGRTPLHTAAFNGRIDAIRILINLGADINTKDKMGNTPLHIAADLNRIEACNALVSLGADLHLPLPDGRTISEAFPDLDVSEAIENYNRFNSTRLAHMAYAAHYEALYRHPYSPKPSRVHAHMPEPHFSHQ